MTVIETHSIIYGMTTMLTVEELPEVPEPYFWAVGDQLNDYYVVDWVELRKKTWWIFSESVHWAGFRHNSVGVKESLLAEAKIMAEKIVES